MCVASSTRVFSLFYVTTHLFLRPTMAIDTIQKSTIIALSEAGLQGKKIASQTGQSLHSVYRVLRNFRNRDSAERPKGSGGPQKLSERDVRGIINYTKMNRRATLREITNDCPLKSQHAQCAGSFMQMASTVALRRRSLIYRMYTLWRGWLSRKSTNSGHWSSGEE
jgi:hypothetical protein